MPELMNAAQETLGSDLLKLVGVVLLIALLRTLERFLGDKPAGRSGK